MRPINSPDSTAPLIPDRQSLSPIIAPPFDAERVRFYKTLLNTGVDEAQILSELVVEQSRMPNSVKPYFSNRPWLTDSVLQRWSAGYLPSLTDTTSTHNLLFRGHIVYSFIGADNRIVGMFAVPPDDYADPFHTYRQGEIAPPQNYWFARSFDAAADIFGLHCFQNVNGRRFQNQPLLVCKQPDFAIKQLEANRPCVAILSQSSSSKQVSRIVDLAHQFTKNRVILMSPRAAANQHESDSLLLALIHAGLSVAIATNSEVN
jgi:hypothetical protein